MLTIPLYVILFIYLAFLVFFAGMVLINLAHLVHTGTFTFGSFIATLFFLALSAIIIFTTWYFLQGVNWQQPLLSWSFSSGTGLNNLNSL